MENGFLRSFLKSGSDTYFLQFFMEKNTAADTQYYKKKGTWHQTKDGIYNAELLA